MDHFGMVIMRLGEADVCQVRRECNPFPSRCIWNPVKRPKMKYYRIVFAKNEIIYCSEIIDQLVKEIPLYEENNGQLIFALVKAESIEDATRQAYEIRDNVLRTHQQQL